MNVTVDDLRRDVKRYRRHRRLLWWLRLLRWSTVVPPKPRL